MKNLIFILLIPVWILMFIFLSTLIKNTPPTLPKTDINKSNTPRTLLNSTKETIIVSEDISLIGNNFTVKSDDNKNIGTIKQEILNFKPVFSFYKEGEAKESTAKQIVFSLFTEIEIYDKNNEYIGKIKHEVFENLFSFRNTYSIYDKNNKRIGSSRKLELAKTTISIYNDEDKLVAEIKRPFINIITDKWELNIYDEIVDKRLVIFIPAYKTYYDNIREGQKDSNSTINNN
jgi:uncharacterized protein YxjI